MFFSISLEHCRNMLKIQLHVKATQKSFFLRQSHLVSKMLLLYCHVDKGDNSIFYSKLMENFWVIPLLREEYVDEKRDNSWYFFFNILFISAFLGGMGCTSIIFCIGFIMSILFLCYFMNHWIPERDFSCVRFFPSVSLL